MKKKKRKFGKPSFIIITLLYLIIKPLYKIKYHLTIDKSGIADLKGPALVLSPHISLKDHFLQELALYPALPTYVLSRHFLANPVIRFFLKAARPISKKMFSADVGTILQILRAKESGNIILMFPEGRLTWYGHSGPLTTGTAELVKKLEIPVYSVISNGAYYVFPKWGMKRRGKIHITTKKILSAEQISEMNTSEINSLLSKELYHSEVEAMHGEKYLCKDTTLGLDSVLYTCPECHSIKTLYTTPNHIHCRNCGMDACLDEYYQLQGTRFTSIESWYDWQVSEINPEEEVLESHASINAVNDKGDMQNGAGDGVIRISKEGLSVIGSLFGQPLDYRIPSTKLIAFPVTPGHHFDIYYNDVLLNVVPDDPKDTMRFVSYCDVLHTQNNSK